MSEYSYVGKGKIYVAKRSPAGALRFLGNCTTLELTPDTADIDLEDAVNAGGGLDDSITRINFLGVQLNMRNLSPDNLALALLGAVTPVAAGAIVDEEHAAYKGGLVRLNNIPDPAVALVVTHTTGSPTYVENTDYVRTKSGFTIPVTGSAIVDAQVLKTDYTKLAGNVVQLLINAADEFRMVFEGLNEAKSGRPAIVDIHRTKFTANQALALIGNEFAGAGVTGRCLRDDLIVTPGISAFAKIELGAA
jgi:hypothetical protein